MKREGEAEESTLLLQKSRKRRPRWCALFLIGREGGEVGGGVGFYGSEELRWPCWELANLNKMKWIEIIELLWKYWEI